MNDAYTFGFRPMCQYQAIPVLLLRRGGAIGRYDQYERERDTPLGNYPHEYCRWCGEPITYAKYCNGDCRSAHRKWGTA